MIPSPEKKLHLIPGTAFIFLVLIDMESVFA